MLKLQKLFQIPTLLAWLLFGTWAATITFLSSMTGQELSIVPGHLLEFDKVVHALAFGAGALLLTISLHGMRPGWSKGRLALAVLLGMALCGALDEYHQEFTPGRSGGDLLDWIADVTGSLMVAIVYYCSYERMHGTVAAEKP